MPFPLFQFITPLEAKPDPNGAVQNAMSGMQSLIDIKKDKQHQAQQSSQFQQEQGLRVNDQLMRGQSMAHGEDKDVAGMLAQYNKFLADGDDASAAGMAPAMKAMGLDLVKRPDGDAQQPAAPTQPDAAPAMPALGGAANAQPAADPSEMPFKARPVPPLLTKFMAAQPKTEEPPPDQLGPIDVEGHDETAVPQAGPGEAPRPAGRLPTYEAFHRGKSLGVIDPNTFHTQNKEAAGRVGGAFLGSLPDNISEQFRPGLDEPATGEEAKDAVHNDLLLTLQGMRSANKGKGGGAGGDLLSNPKEASRFSTDVRGWVSEFTKDNDTKSLNKTAVQADTVLGALSGNPSGLDERVALGRQVKELFGAAASEGERGFILGSSGELGKVDMWIKSWIDSGKIPVEMTTALRAVASRSRAYASHRVVELGKAAADKILNSPVGARASPEERAAMRELIISDIAGEYGVDNPTPQHGASAAPPKKPGVYNK